MYLRKQVKIFCGSNGSTNYDDLQNKHRLTQSQMDDYLKLHEKKYQQ